MLALICLGAAALLTAALAFAERSFGSGLGARTFLAVAWLGAAGSFAVWGQLEGSADGWWTGAATLLTASVATGGRPALIFDRLFDEAQESDRDIGRRSIRGQIAVLVVIAICVVFIDA